MQLIRYDAACRALAECKAVDEVKDWRDKAQALQAYAKQAKNKQLEVDAAEIRIRAERRLGQMLHAEGPQVGRPEKSSTAPRISDLGISYDLSSRAQAIASIEEEEFEATLAEHREEQQAVTGRTMEKLARKAHVSNNSGENEWYTPPRIIELARAVMGGIDFDPASCDLANEIVKAKTYRTKENSGLECEWHGRVWMNPPYAQPLIAQFCEKVVLEWRECRIDHACVLVNNGTETAWGQGLLSAASAVCFPASRIRFIDKDGNPSGAPLQGQMIVYFGGDRDSFAAAFHEIGACFFG